MRTTVLAMALGACAPVAEANMAQSVESEIKEFGSGKVCRAEGLNEFVGRPATPELAAAARDRAGAASVRWLQPGTVVTMEFREDRLNIHLDARNRVTRLACG